MKKYLIVILLFFIGLGLIIVPNHVTESSIDTIKVDIKGAVLNPGVYTIKNDSRVIDQTTPNMIRDNIAKNLIIAEI